MKRIFGIMSLLMIVHSSFSQTTMNINNHTYIQHDNKWYIQNKQSSIEYQVNEKFVSIKFRKDIKTINDGLNYLNSRGLELKEIRRNSLGYVDIEVPVNLTVFQLVSRLSSSPIIDLVEINTIGQYDYTPNDTYFNQQWYINKIKANLGWENIGGNDDIVVAIIDSGVEWTHDDLGTGNDNYQNIWLNPSEDVWTSVYDPSTGNDVDNDNNGFIDDWKGWDFDDNDNDSRGTFYHGTSVAGIVGAKTDNNKGIAGIAGGLGEPGVKLMILNVGHSSPNGGVLDDAILYAAHNGAKIIQMSLNVAPSQAINDAISDAYNNHNVTLVCSSGNLGGNEVLYPASDDNVISVGSTNANDYKSDFSSYGTGLEIAAPGENIYSTTINNTYVGNLDGTSFAAPQVSGTAALLLSINPTLTPDNIRTILRSSAEKVGGYNYNWDANHPGHSIELGYGRLDVDAAVNELFVITGSSFICSSGSIFSFPYAPSNSNIVWSTSQNITRSSIQGSNPCTFVPNGSGSGTISATISISGGNPKNIGPLTIWVGPPVLDYITAESGGSGYTGQSSAFAVWPPNSHISNPEPVWYVYPYANIWYNQNSYAQIEWAYAGTYEISAYAYNTCGSSNTVYYSDFYVYDYLFSISPNPASEEITITVNKNNSDNVTYPAGSDPVYDISIYDMIGNLKIQKKYSGERFLIPVSSLKDGNYFVKISYGKITSTKQLIIKH